jgi:hypothetical protein
MADPDGAAATAGLRESGAPTKFGPHPAHIWHGSCRMLLE